jgi:hypothetical protein
MPKSPICTVKRLDSGSGLAVIPLEIEIKKSKEEV